MLKFLVGFLIVCMIVCSAHASDHGWDPNSPVSKWVRGLYQPDTPPDERDYLHSCCGEADMYPIVIEQDALGDEGDSLGVARITDGSAKQYPDGAIRPPLKTGMTFRFPKSKVNPLKDGNPTATAWVFLSSYDGEINRIFCIIPLPPGM